jgi:hypothetical protein
MNSIPPITDPDGRYWTQPDRDGILIDDKYACMSEGDFDLLKNYSLSTPTGTYVGKMWKMHHNGKWYLRWYDSLDGPNIIIETREILDVEA